MDLMKLGANLLDIAKKVAPLIVPGGAQVLDLANSVVKTINEIKKSLDPAILPELEAARDDLEARVNAHVDRTADSLK